MAEDCGYLAGTPKSFAKSCDVLLRLDDGSELPAHSQVLARLSSVCADMLDDGPLSDASAHKKITQPLTDCSRATVTALLTALYSAQPILHIERASCMDVATLAHKLDMKDIVRLCDAIISSAAVYPEHDVAMSSIFLRDKDLDSFRDMMDSAMHLGMRRLLACCEHCIAWDDSGKFDEILQHLPPGSTVRIIDCLRRMRDKKDIYSMATRWDEQRFLSSPSSPRDTSNMERDMLLASSARRF